MAASSHSTLLVATLDDEPVGVAVMYISHETAWLRGGAVVPAARQQGIHRALIAERARIAAAAGCTLVGAWAAADSRLGAATWRRSGFERIGTREHHAYVPASVAEAVG